MVHDLRVSTGYTACVCQSICRMNRELGTRFVCVHGVHGLCVSINKQAGQRARDTVSVSPQGIFVYVHHMQCEQRTGYTVCVCPLYAVRTEDLVHDLCFHGVHGLCVSRGARFVCVHRVHGLSVSTGYTVFVCLSYTG